MRNPDRSQPRPAIFLPSRITNDGWWLVADLPIPCTKGLMRPGCAFLVLDRGERRLLRREGDEGMLVGPTSAKERRRADMAKVLARLAAGAIKPVIAATFPLSQAAAAMERSEARGLFGKVVIVP